jgi:hypothetical protein
MKPTKRTSPKPVHHSPSQHQPHDVRHRASTRHYSTSLSNGRTARLRATHAVCDREPWLEITGSSSASERPVLPAITIPISLSTLVLPQRSRSPCFWRTGHVHCAPLPTVPPVTASVTVSPSSLELAWQPSWRPRCVAQRSGQRASGRLTCGRKILDSINMMACKCRVTFSILSPFHPDPPHRLAAHLCGCISTAPPEPLAKLKEQDGKPAILHVSVSRHHCAGKALTGP